STTNRRTRRSSILRPTGAAQPGWSEPSSSGSPSLTEHLHGRTIRGVSCGYASRRPASCRCAVLIAPGRAALSVARQSRALATGWAVCPGFRGLAARWLPLVVTTRPLTAAEATQLDAMLAYGPIDAGPPISPAGSVETLVFYVAPRVGTTSPWSSQ